MEAAGSPNPTPARDHARGLAGWLKFFGIVSIIGGAVNALTIVGIVWAWLPIWLGILLVQAGSRASDYAARGDDAALEGLLGRLKTYYLINGIAVLVTVAFGLLALIALVVLTLVGLVSLPAIMESLRSFSSSAGF